MWLHVVVLGSMRLADKWLKMALVAASRMLHLQALAAITLQSRQYFAMRLGG